MSFTDDFLKSLHGGNSSAAYGYSPDDYAPDDYTGIFLKGLQTHHDQKQSDYQSIRGRMQKFRDRWNAENQNTRWRSPEETASFRQEMESEANALYHYINRVKDSYGPADAESYAELFKMGHDLEETRSGLDKYEQYWGQWNSQEMFDNYTVGEQNREYNEYATQQAELARGEYEKYLQDPAYLARQKEYAPTTYAQMVGGVIPQLDPFESTEEGKRAAELKSKMDYWDLAVQQTGDEMIRTQDMQEFYSWPEEDRELLERYADHREGGAGTILGQAHWQFFLSQHDLKKLGEKYGYEKVDQIAESVTRSKNQEGAQWLADKTEEWTEKLPGATGHSALSVGASVANAITGPLGYLYESMNRSGRYSTLDPNNAGNMFGQYAGGVRGNVGENLREHGPLGEAADILYQGGMSALDSMARLAVGGEGMALTLAATGAFSDTVRDASARGASPMEATFMGIADGGLEVLTEKISLDNLLDDIAASPRNAMQILRSAAIQGGIEVSEEELSYLGSLAAESLILREKSSYNQRIAELMVEENKTQEEAKDIANRELWHEAVNTALVSFVSGDMMSSVQQGAANVQHKSHITQEGKAINRAQGGSSALLAMADSLVEGSSPETMTAVQQKAAAYKDAVNGRKPNGHRANVAAGELQEAVWGSISEQSKGTLAKSLSRKGFEKGAAAEMADALVAYSQGKPLTKKQQRLVAKGNKNLKVMRAVAQTISNPKSTSGHKAVKMNAFSAAVREGKIENADMYAKMATDPAKFIQEKMREVDEYKPGADHHIADDGKTYVGGNPVELSTVSAVRDGKLEIRLQDGKTVSSDSVTYASEDDAIVYEAVARVAPNAAIANQMISDYRSAETSARDYAMGIQQAYDFGAHSISTDELLKADLASKITPHQRATAYKAGKIGGIRQMTAAHAELSQKAKPAGHRGGTVDLSYVTTDKSQWNAKQTEAVKTWEKLASMTGVEFVAFESYEDESGNRVFIDPQTGKQAVDNNGDTVTAPNGFYKDGKVFVDLNAGVDAEGTMLFTTGHELTHFIREWSPAKYRALAEILTEFYGKSGMSVDDMVRAQIEKAKADNRSLTYDEAFEEFVADSMESILADGKVVEFMAKTKQRDRSLWEKIRDWFQHLAEDLQKLIDAYDGAKPDSAEGQVVQASQDLLDKLEPIFAEGLVEAGENLQEAELMERENETGSTSVESTTRYSYRSLAEAAGFGAVEEDGFRYFTRNGQRVSEVTVEDIENSPIGAFINYSVDKKDISDDDAQRQKQMFADVCNMAIKTNDFGMAMQFAGSAVFTGMKANADKQYGTTYDFPSICTKTQAMIDAMSARMVAKGRGLEQEELVGLYQDVFASGNPVPCPECYVFSHWIGIGGLLDKIKTYQEFYKDMDPAEVSAYYREMKAEVEAYVNMLNSDPNTTKKITFGRARGAMAKKLTKEYNALYEKVTKADNQGEKVKDADRKRLESLEMIMNTVNGMTWLENVYFADAKFTQVSDKAFVPDEILFDLNNGERFASEYPQAWAFRTTQGAGYGKAITPYAEARLGEGVLATNNTSKTIKSKAAGGLNNYFLDLHGKVTKQAKDALDRARQKQKNQAFIGGQRFQSTSDARYENASDYLLAALEMQATHGMVQVYTKVDGAVPAFANWGFSINQSLMPLGGGLNAKGEVVDTSVGGMNKKVASENRLKFRTAGTITIGVNDNHIRAMFKQLIRDFIIPYHASGGKADIVSTFRAIQEGQDKHGRMVRSTDYTRTQSDKILSDVVLQWLGKSSAEIDTIHKNRAARIAILTGGKPNMQVVRANHFLSDLYDKIHGGEWDGVKLAKAKFEDQIYPNEFWDQSVSYEDSAKITRDYLQYCEDLGFLHRFSGMVPSNGILIPVKGYDQNGQRVELTDLAYQYKDGKKTGEVEGFFWKVLTDRRMYDNEGAYLPQQVVTLNDTTTDTMSDFARKSVGRSYNKEIAEKLAKEVMSKDYSSGEAKLSQRDPRAMKTAKALEKHNQKLQYDIQDLRELLKLQGVQTGGHQYNPKDVYSSARKLIRDHNATGDYHELAGHLTEFYNHMQNSADVSWEGIVDAAAPAMQWLQTHQKEKISKAAAERMMEHNSWTEDIYDSYWKIRTLITPADIIADKDRTIEQKNAEIADILRRHKTAMDAAERFTTQQIREIQNEAKADRDALAKKMRADAAAKVEATAKRYQEARAANVEGRQKTEVRNKIKNVLHDLEKILLRGNRQRNVKAGMVDYAYEALATAQILTYGELTDDAVLAAGQFGGLSVEESKLLNRLNDLDAQISNYPVSAAPGQPIADFLDGRNKLERQRAKVLKELKPTIEAERHKLNKATFNGAFYQLAEAYHQLADSKDDYIKGAYREAVYTYLQGMGDAAAGTPLSEMSKDQLETIYQGYKMVLESIRRANQVFLNGKAEDLEKRTNAVQAELARNKVDMSDLPAEIADALDTANAFTWNMLAPVDAFARIGSDSFTELFWEAVEAQGKYGRLVEEVKDAVVGARQRHGYSNFDLKTAKSFDLEDGKTFRVNLEDMMSIYAYSKRPQAHDHMTRGGFAFDTGSTYTEKKSGIEYKHKKLTSPYLLSDADIDAILTEFMKNHAAVAYVDELQKFMTDFGGRYGNEASRMLYGIDLFKEEAYFPLMSETDYRSATEQAMERNTTMVSLANTGMTKSTVPKAHNPIVLKGFDTVVLEHLDKMSKYASYVIAIDNLQKVFNAVSDQGTGDYVSTQAYISSIFGDAARKYFEQYITDLNGGNSGPSGAQNPLMKFFGRAKGVQVAANLSVVIQQYSAIFRAMAEIDPIYFMPNSVTSKAAGKIYDEMKKYAPVAVIKEMGGFDIGNVRGIDNYIGLEEAPMSGKKAKKAVDDVLGWGPEMMDKLGWMTIWQAVKNQVAHTTKLKPGSEEFLQECGKVFTETVTKTQVYNSVNSRSGYMRSKHDSVQFLTSFMGEPARITGMAFTAANDLRRAIQTGTGVKEAAKKAGRTGMAMMVSMIANGMLKAIPYAMRDDDEEEEAFFEKWALQFGSSLRGDLNPLSYLPVFRDLLSVAQGWDIERPDVTLAADLILNTQRLIKALQDDTTTPEHWLKLAGDVGNVLGFPMKNILREVNAFINTWKMATDDEVPNDMGGSFWRGISGDRMSKEDRLYEAIMEGNDARIAGIQKTYTSDTAYHSALRKLLRERDPRILEAATLRYNGDAVGFKRKFKEIQAEGRFEFDDIMSAINSEVNEMKPDTLPKEPDPLKESFYQEYGYTWGNRKQLYMDGGISPESLVDTYMEIEGKTREEAERYVNKLTAEVETGIAYDDIREAFMENRISEDQVREMYIKYGGYSENEAHEKATVMAFVKENPDCSDITFAAIEDYNTYCRDAGIPAKTFYDTKKYYSSIEGAKKDAVMDYINSLPLSTNQKDAMYYSFGWAESKLYEAPWY